LNSIRLHVLERYALLPRQRPFVSIKTFTLGAEQGRHEKLHWPRQLESVLNAIVLQYMIKKSSLYTLIARPRFVVFILLNLLCMGNANTNMRNFLISSLMLIRPCVGFLH